MDESLCATHHLPQLSECQIFVWILLAWFLSIETKIEGPTQVFNDVLKGIVRMFYVLKHLPGWNLIDDVFRLICLSLQVVSASQKYVIPKSCQFEMIHSVCFKA